jgi:hypothetical protein
MLEEKKVQEECLYCHGQLELGNLCPFCGDAKLGESLKSDPSAQTILMFRPEPSFELQIAGV